MRKSVSEGIADVNAPRLSDDPEHPPVARVPVDVHGQAGFRSGASVAAKPFVLAAFFDGHPTDGGQYVHKRGTLRVLRDLQRPDLKVVVICDSAEAAAVARQHGLRAVTMSRTFGSQLLGRLAALRITRRALGRSLGPKLSPIDRLMRQLEVDLVFFAGQDPRARQLYGYSYIFTVMDLCHLENPDFPEVAHAGEFDRREALFQDVLRGAAGVIADSEHGRNLVARHYGVPIDRVAAAPFLIDEQFASWVSVPEHAAKVAAKYGLEKTYLFYPAQFWAHKNHRYIISALYVMKQKFGEIPQAVFCGSDKGALQQVQRYAESLCVQDRVKYCGFVPSEDLPYLYAGALALVMPTYFGPTNIPPMEAAALGVPVCYSDFPSFREQMGAGATYVDLERPETLADALHRLATQPACPAVAATEARAQDERYLHVLRRMIGKFRRRTIDPLAAD